jgi:tyrosine-protein kinase Etk/Wzc
MMTEKRANYIKILLKRRHLIIKNVLLVVFITAIITLLIPNKYTATATVLPPNPEQDAMFGFLPGIMSGAISSNISSMLTGVVSGVSTPSDLYATIMKSSRIKREIIAKYDLMNIFKTKTMHDAFQSLDDITNIDISPEGIISIAVTNKDKYLATNIANSYVEELDRFNTETAMTTGKKYRIFIEKRLKESMDSLAQAENALKLFQEEHRTVALDVEVQSVIKTIAEIKSQIILLEVRKGALAASSNLNNPYLYNIDRDLSELRKQLSKIEFGKEKQRNTDFGVGFSIPFSQLPSVSLEYARLYREVKVQEVIYELLTQQFEQAKIMELKDTPSIQFLDTARVPEKKSSPKRTLYVFFAFFVSLFANILLVFMVEYLADVKATPSQHSSIIIILESLVADINQLFQFIKKIFKKR